MGGDSESRIKEICASNQDRLYCRYHRAVRSDEVTDQGQKYLLHLFLTGA